MTSGREKMRVAVMGATGSGKTSFVNVASGSNLAVSDSLESCTIDVETSTFFLDGRTVTLIDTPGFDDTTRSDTSVLKSITDYLSSSYRQGVKLAGVIYMHRITDNKMSGPSKKNLHILRNLCGDDNLRNVLLVTTMWSDVAPHVGEARERELASKENFFKPAIDRGARMLRHDGSQTSAHAIIRHLADREPSTLLVDDEMVNQGKDLAHTTVGADIVRQLQEKAEHHTAALDELCLGIEAASLAEDEEMREMLEEEVRRARETVQRIWGDLERMATNFAANNSRLEDENRRYKKDLKKQKVDAEYNVQLFEQERRARELAEAGKRQAEERLAAQRESRERGKGGYERQEHGYQEQDHDTQDRENQEKEGRDRERQEKEKQDREKHQREREEHRKKEREWRETIDRAKKEQERMQKEFERLEKEKKDAGSRCLIQ